MAPRTLAVIVINGLRAYVCLFYCTTFFKSAMSADQTFGSLQVLDLSHNHTKGGIPSNIGGLDGFKLANISSESTYGACTLDHRMALAKGWDKHDRIWPCSCSNYLLLFIYLSSNAINLLLAFG